ncbi:MAG: OmpA family protein [Chitinivibrionales bacterium]|nr:OmpA family protein [Chitinivibrionales bacterium]MBD3394126.1 OmpA family protein [Chitinivibrionales bacterium]
MPGQLILKTTASMLVAAVSLSVAAVNGGGQESVVRTLSAKTHGKGKLIVGVGANYAQDAEFVKGPALNNYGNVLRLNDGPVDPSLLESGKMLSSSFFLSMGATSWLDFAAMVPVYYDWAGFGNVRDGGIGDVDVSMKLLYPPPAERRLYYQAYYVGVSIPVGMKTRGLFPRHPYLVTGNERETNPAENFYSAGLVSIQPMIVWTFDIGAVADKFPLEIIANFGGVMTFDFDKNNTLVGNLALNLSPAEVIDIFVDFAGESRLANFSGGFTLANDPIYASPGIRINTPAGVYLQLAGDFCVSPFVDKTRYDWEKKDHQYSTAVRPRWGFNFQFGWDGFLAVQDDDRDGVKNDVDRCPKDPEDLDGFEDSDGCPDTDNDKDGIDDVKDKCPGKAEDQDGFEDEDGCPDPDNDGDGIPDQQDQCPRIAEDFDGFEDKDGCIDDDNDKDGILDSLDKCPNDPEDVDKFEDDDGCPDIDNDKDGITDLKDKCPNKAETINGLDDEDGCPDEKRKEPKMPKHQIMKGINFKSGSVEMTFDSYQYLEPIIKTMKEYPHVEIEIRGHTDSVGKYSSNMRLSQMRAEAVRQHLISKGVDGGRMRAVGFGPSSPIADNRTAAGRAKNRRIEIVRIK